MIRSKSFARLAIGVAIMLGMILFANGATDDGELESQTAALPPFYSIPFSDACISHAGRVGGALQLAALTKQDFDCCTNCHSANQAPPVAPASSSLLASCGHCHTY